jgi:hypothetical protein
MLISSLHHSIVTIIQCGNIIYLLQFFIVRIYTGHTHTVGRRLEEGGRNHTEGQCNRITPHTPNLNRNSVSALYKIRTHSTPWRGAFFPSNQCKIALHSAPHQLSVGGGCGDYHANFSIVGRVVLLQGGGPPLKPPTKPRFCLLSIAWCLIIGCESWSSGDGEVVWKSSKGRKLRTTPVFVHTFARPTRIIRTLFIKFPFAPHCWYVTVPRGAVEVEKSFEKVLRAGNFAQTPFLCTLLCDLPELFAHFSKNDPFAPKFWNIPVPHGSVEMEMSIKTFWGREVSHNPRFCAHCCATYPELFAQFP